MHATIFSLMAFTLGAGVVTAIAAEFLRGANVVRTQTGKNLLESTVLLVRRNTRRYGGYIIHFGIVVMFIGIAGGAFNQQVEQEMSYGDTMTLGPYTMVCRSITQDSTPNYNTDFALLDVYRGGKKITQLAPERRMYFPDTDHAQAQTMVALHSTLESDLYVVFYGRSPDTGRPIIRAFLNPLIAWIWIGVIIVVLGTFVALTPNMTRTAVRQRQEEPAGVGAGAAGLGAAGVLAKAPHA
jgi:cytochrome c-type biogenesis protein CcmF